MLVTSAFRMLFLEDCKCEVSLGYIAISHLEIKTKPAGPPISLNLWPQ